MESGICIGIIGINIFLILLKHEEIQDSLFIYLFIYFFVCFVSLIIFLPLLNNDSIDSEKVSIYSGKFYYLIFKYIHIIRSFYFRFVIKYVLDILYARSYKLHI